jgi:hypothetical protein
MIGLESIYVKSLPNIKTPKLFGTTWTMLSYVSVFHTRPLVCSYTPTIMMHMEIRNAQRRPSHAAREPPSHNWATPVHVSHLVVNTRVQYLPVIAHGIVATKPDLLSLIS